MGTLVAALPPVEAVELAVEAVVASTPADRLSTLSQSTRDNRDEDYEAVEDEQYEADQEVVTAIDDLTLNLNE